METKGNIRIHDGEYTVSNNNKDKPGRLVQIEIEIFIDTL